MGTPSLFVTPAHAYGRRERPPPAPPPLTRWGGGSWLLLLHPVGAAPVPRAAAAKARAALPDRSSKPQTATPSGRYSRDRSAARARTAAAMHSAAAPASASGGATPSAFRQPRRWHWLPRHPTHARPPRGSSQGVSARSSPAARPPCRPGTHSLSGPRRCPRSMTPVGCCRTGSRLLAALPSHGALRQRSGQAAAAGSSQGVRNGTGNGSNAAAFLRITLHNYTQ